MPDAAVTLALGDNVDEAMNTIQLGGTDWNDAVKAYNTRRVQIKGEIMARVSVDFGLDLPVNFPYYQGSKAGKPIQNPLATPIPYEKHFCMFLGSFAAPKTYKKLLIPNFQLGVIFEQ